jgi:hypothetical protein
MASSSRRRERDRDRDRDRDNDPASLPIAQLQVTPQEAQLLLVAQHQALTGGGANSRSSRAASAASSQGRLLLDPSSLQALSNHFDRLIVSIQARWTEVCSRLPKIVDRAIPNANIAVCSKSSSYPESVRSRRRSDCGRRRRDGEDAANHGTNR